MTGDAERTLYSASQIDTYRQCARKWGLRYIDGIKTDPHPSAALGTEVDDEQIQPYMRGERPGFDYSKPAKPTARGGAYLASGDIAASMLPLLPKPNTVHVQHYFQIPSPTSTEYGFHGYADFWTENSERFPDRNSPVVFGSPVSVGVVPGIGDTKTTINVTKWSKSAKELSENPQAMLYATAAMLASRTEAVDLFWIYGQTQNNAKSKQVHLRVFSDHVANQMRAIDATAGEMHAVRKRVPAGQAMTLPANRDACDSYGGCPHWARCALTFMPDIGTQRKNTMTPQEKLAALKAKAGQQSQGLSAVPPTSTPAPAAAGAAPAALPSPAVQPPAGINPPESALPPAPAVSAAAPAEEKPKRGRPKKEEAKQEDDAPAYMLPRFFVKVVGKRVDGFDVEVSYDAKTIDEIAPSITQAIAALKTVQS